VATHGQPRTFELVELSLQTGAVIAGKTIDGSTTPTMSNAKGVEIAFDPNCQLNRPGLLLADNRVFVAFGSDADSTTCTHDGVTHIYRGWVMALDSVSLAFSAVYTTTPDRPSGGGGVWQGSNGPAADDQGNVYLVSGNGLDTPAPSSPIDQEDSFVRLSANGNGTLPVLSSYAPVDTLKPFPSNPSAAWYPEIAGSGLAAPSNDRGSATKTLFEQMEENDADLGSGGVLVIPDAGRHASDWRRKDGHSVPLRPRAPPAAVVSGIHRPGLLARHGYLHVARPP